MVHKTTIFDADATIGFESAAYVVTEEVGLLNVSVKVLSGDLGRRVLLRLDTIGGSADGKMAISLYQPDSSIVWLISLKLD